MTLLKLEDYLPAIPSRIKIELERCDGDRFVTVNGEILDPRLSQKIRNHSPDGFNWGYSGSGPAQLALAILLLYLPVELAERHYQDFKFQYIAGLTGDKIEVDVPLKLLLTHVVQN